LTAPVVGAKEYELVRTYQVLDREQLTLPGIMMPLLSCRAAIRSSRSPGRYSFNGAFANELAGPIRDVTTRDPARPFKTQSNKRIKLRGRPRRSGRFFLV
jgi:hypothetical protein